jgi:hypothetical protein
MSASRRITVARYPLSAGRRVDVEVWYPTLRDMARRYTLSVQPVTVRGDGMTVYTPVEGYRSTLENAPRFNARRLEALASDPAVMELAARMVEQVRADEAARVGGAA